MTGAGPHSDGLSRKLAPAFTIWLRFLRTRARMVPSLSQPVVGLCNKQD